MSSLDKKTLFLVFIFVVILNGAITQKTSSSELCSEHGDCLSGPVDCNNLCGCDRSVDFITYYYNETTGQCEVNMKYLLEVVSEKYNSEEKVYQEAERVFQRVIIAAIIFGTCASLCGLSACIYCFYMNYSDQRLKHDVKALAIKLGRNHRIKKPTKIPIKPKSQSCNVIVEDAGVFVC